MGTNIYLVRQITDAEIKETKQIFNKAIKELKTSLDVYKVLQPVEDQLNKLKEEIHICKRSYGWQLLFQSHKELYACTWKAMTDYIKKVLKEGKYVLKDEYGEDYTLEDLKHDLDYFSKGFTGESYDKKMREKGTRHISCEDHEYISDGLRWTDDYFC